MIKSFKDFFPAVRRFPNKLGGQRQLSLSPPVMAVFIEVPATSPFGCPPTFYGKRTVTWSLTRPFEQAKHIWTQMKESNLTRFSPYEDDEPTLAPFLHKIFNRK